MGRSPTKTFIVGNKTIVVKEPRKLNGRFIVTCSVKGGWTVSRVLGKQKAAWFILRCAMHLKKADLRKPVMPGRLVPLLVGSPQFKMSGAEWISLRMVHGARPIILKAPQLFRGRVIYIEPTSREGQFTLRVVDPLTTVRTEPVVVDENVVNEAIRTFDNSQRYERDNTQERG